MYDKYGASPAALAPQNRPLWLPGEGGVSTLQRNTAEIDAPGLHEGRGRADGHARGQDTCQWQLSSLTQVTIDSCNTGSKRCFAQLPARQLSADNALSQS